MGIVRVSAASASRGDAGTTVALLEIIIIVGADVVGLAYVRSVGAVVRVIGLILDRDGTAVGLRGVHLGLIRRKKHRQRISRIQLGLSLPVTVSSINGCDGDWRGVRLGRKRRDGNKAHLHAVGATAGLERVWRRECGRRYGSGYLAG